MKILFHCGVGNKDRPHRWKFVAGLYSDLARMFESLGHECFLIAHTQAKSEFIFHRSSLVDEVSRIMINESEEFIPDYVFTWNGVSEGDQKIINYYGKKKMIYGELGIFGHYDKTCYFNVTGVNGKLSQLGMNFRPTLDSVEDKKIIDKLRKEYQKPRLCKEPHVFVPLQDETDTQIMKYSPFKKMDELLDYVETLFMHQGIKILYKMHPKAPCELKSRRGFEQVFDDVHHYLPYADFIIGINSTVLTEALIYDNVNIISVGLGPLSRHWPTVEEQHAFIGDLYRSQLKWIDLKDPSKVSKAPFYRHMLQ